VRVSQRYGVFTINPYMHSWWWVSWGGVRIGPLHKDIGSARRWCDGVS
jgi:hypothetical protein